ncbi:MAG TPA: 3-phosphoshikimate 1-carboxyvinyltransferase [Chitinophagaceae bacterium]
MEIKISPSTINGDLYAPASKSVMQRAYAAALIRNGKTIIHNPGKSGDDKAALSIIKELGAQVESNDDEVIVVSKGIYPTGNHINCNESGVSIRMFTPIAAVSGQEINITGTGSLLSRPIGFFNTVFPTLSVEVSTNSGFLPINVKGPLVPRSTTVDGSQSSQFITGLLMAYSAAEARGVTINVTNLQSKPYIDLTLGIMEAFGLNTPVNDQYNSFYFPSSPNGKAIEKDLHYAIEGDWSGASFLLVAGAISGNVTVRGLNIDSFQGDKAILQVLKESGALVDVDKGVISIRKNALQPFQFDATDSPDLFPPLVALASRCDGRSVIKGVERLLHKESNRALTLKEEFGKMGVEVQLEENKMFINGGGSIRSATVDSHNDHRIAMACAITAINAGGTISINNAEAINKSYPDFWNDLQKIGGVVTLSHNS